VPRRKQLVRRCANGSVRPEAHVAAEINVDNKDGPQFHRFVTFYFTNFLPYLSNFYLRKGLWYAGRGSGS